MNIRPPQDAPHPARAQRSEPIALGGHLDRTTVLLTILGAVMLLVLLLSR
ncbi:MAG: hypothetical protein H6837_00815 [Planctomycetes bacterium]|nr:hypothetical protein [Planctomycetota bacterium]